MALHQFCNHYRCMLFHAERHFGDIKIMTRPQLVEDKFNITDHEIQKAFEEKKDDYWRAVRDFWWQIKEREVAHLSTKQTNWLAKIENNLDEEFRPRWNTEETQDAFDEEDLYFEKEDCPF